MWSIGYVEIARDLAADIERGVLRAGDRLPSTRTLAARLGVARNTVVAAFDELVAQGWVTSRGAAGTFVTDGVPVVDFGAARARTRAGARDRCQLVPYALPDVPPALSPVSAPNARVLLSAGVPDPRLFPHDIFARAYRRALRSRAAASALSYGDALGTPRLRTAIAAMLRATRAMPVGPEHVMITRGSQMGLDLAARALIRRGDVAAVEALGYQPAWRALSAAGATLAAVPLDDHGLVVDALPARPRVIYTTPHHQYPTTVLMAPARRLALLARARRDGIAILEDDYDHEFHFDGRPVAPLASTDPAVIYLGTLSKILAPGLRLGFVVAPAPVIAAFGAIRAAIDRQGDHVLELAVAELVEDGEIQRHARKLRRIYAARRDAFADLLRTKLPVDFTLPPGGITVWARVPDDVRLDAWQARCLDAGVAFATARDLALDRKPRPFIRLAFARYTESELADAVRVLGRVLA